MRSFSRIALCLLALVALAGCASTKVTESESYDGERLARPDRIIVHDFAATPADIPAWAVEAGRPAAPSTWSQRSQRVHNVRWHARQYCAPRSTAFSYSIFSLCKRICARVSTSPRKTKTA